MCAVQLIGLHCQDLYQVWKTLFIISFSRNSLIKLTDLNSTLLSPSGSSNCAQMATSGSLTQAQCYQSSKTFAACEYVDGSTVANEPCRFPFR